MRAALAACLLAGVAGGELALPTLATDFVLTNAPAFVNTVTTPSVAGSQLVLTNCVVRPAAGTVQDLTGAGVVVYVGHASTSVTYQATVQVATSGTFTCRVALPAAPFPGLAQGINWGAIAIAVTSGTDVVSYPDERQFYLKTRLY